MILPYINKKIEEKSSIYMICENNNEAKEKIEILLNKLEIKNKEKIKINWNIIQENATSENIYIVSGDEEFINKKNEEIKTYYSDKENIMVKIINCYEVNENCKLKEIIEKNGYKKILNTKGESAINY
jgi:hypothetical protein